MGKMDKRTDEIHTDHRQYQKTMPAAKATLTKVSKRYRADLLEAVNDPMFRFGIAEVGQFHKHIEASRKAKNMMSGEWFVEPINTPAYMSQERESYWSM